MDSRPERRLGHADYRNTELGVRMRTQARPVGRVEIGIAIDHQQGQPANAAQNRARRRQFPPEELTRPVRHHLGHDRGAFGQHHRERGIGSHNNSRPGTAGTGIVHVHGRKDATAGTTTDLHTNKMPLSMAQR